MANLGPQLIKNSYQDLVQITASNALAKGDGTSISNISVTSSWAINALTASFVDTASTNAFVQGGNSFGVTTLLGTNDNQNLQFETSGSVRVHIGNNGNVGIGTTSPTQRLDVRDGFIQVSGSGASGYGYLLNRAGQDTYSIRHLDGGLTINNETDSIKEMTFLGNGNVGINKINPSARLEIRGSGATSATTALRVENSNATASLVVRDDGNVGIGTATPASRLQVSLPSNTSNQSIFRSDAGDNLLAITTFPTTNRIQLLLGDYNGTATPNLAAISDSNTGIQWAGSDIIRFVNGGSENVTINASGNVGIGTTSPTARLQIAGTSDDGISLDANSTSFNGVNARLPGRIIVGSSNILYPRIMYNAVPSSSLSWRYLVNDTAWAISMGNSNRMSFEYVAPGAGGTSFNSWNTIMTLVSGSNRVGIGTTNPRAALHVSAGDISLDGARHLDWANGDNRIIGGSAGGYSLQFQTWTGAALTEKMRISGSGEVGIGVTNMTAKLHVSGANADNLFRVSSPSATNALFVSGSGNVGIGTTTPGVTLDVSGNIRSNGVVFSSTTQTQNLTINSAAQLQFRNTSSVEVGRFDNAGNWGIGTTSPTSRLQVRGSGATSATTALRVENSNATASLVVLDDGNVGIGTATPTTLLHISGSDSAQMMRINSPTNANILFVSGSGRVGIGTTTPNSTLDVNGNTIITGSITNTSTITTLGSVVTPTQTIAVGNGFGNSSGTTNLLNIAGNLVPTATAIINSLAITSTVSQSVNPTTIIRGILVSPTFNTLGPQYRGFEWNNNQGFGLYGVGAAPNYLSGSLGLGTTNPLARLHVSGSDGNDFLRITSGSQNILNIRSGSAVFFAGTGVAPTSGFDLDIQGTGTANGGSVRIVGNSTVWQFASVASVTRGGTGNTEMFNVTMGGTSTTAIQNPMSITFNANQNPASGSGYTVLRLNATHATTAGTGSKLLQTWEFAGVQRSVVNITGSIGVGITAPSASVHISSSLGLPPMLTITPHSPLPTTNIPTGTFMVSASVPPRPYMWDGTSWYAL